MTPILGSEQALAPVREPDTFCEGASAIKNLLKKLYLCNKYALAEGGLLRTYMFAKFLPPPRLQLQAEL